MTSSICVNLLWHLKLMLELAQISKKKFNILSKKYPNKKSNFCWTLLKACETAENLYPITNFEPKNYPRNFLEQFCSPMYFISINSVYVNYICKFWGYIPKKTVKPFVCLNCVCRFSNSAYVRYRNRLSFLIFAPFNSRPNCLSIY